MPTTRARHQITETPPVAAAIDRAAQRWPGEPRSKLIIRLVKAGDTALQREAEKAEQVRADAVTRLSGKYTEAFDDDHLADLRRDWPA